MVSKAIGLLTLLIGLFGAHLWDKHNAVQLAVQNVELKAKNEQSKIESILLTQHFQRLDEKDNELESVSNKLAVATRRLQQRPSRSNSTTSCTPGPITGAQLSREDGGFLAGEAARAQRILVERDYYYQEYEKARLTLEQYGKQK